MKKWLLDIASNVQSVSGYKDEKNGMKMAIGTVLIVFFQNNYIVQRIHLQHDEQALLLSLLKVEPNTEARSCNDFYHLKGLMDTSTVGKAVQAVTKLCTSFSVDKHLSSIEWLYAIPFLHFLGEKCTPFQKFSFNHEKLLEVWEDKLLSTSTEKAVRLDQAAQQGKYK